MTLEQLQDIEWLEPWEAVEAGLETELAREVSATHPLHRVKAISVGRRTDSDDVLFFLPEHSQPLAVVHLTWTKELGAKWPWTVFYSSVDDWVKQCMKSDHYDYKSNLA